MAALDRLLSTLATPGPPVSRRWTFPACFRGLHLGVSPSLVIYSLSLSAPLSTLLSASRLINQFVSVLWHLNWTVFISPAIGCNIHCPATSKTFLVFAFTNPRLTSSSVWEISYHTCPYTLSFEFNIIDNSILSVSRIWVPPLHKKRRKKERKSKHSALESLRRSLKAKSPHTDIDNVVRTIWAKGVHKQYLFCCGEYESISLRTFFRVFRLL